MSDFDSLDEFIAHHHETSAHLKKLSEIQGLTHNAGFWSGYFEAIDAVRDFMTRGIDK